MIVTFEGGVMSEKSSVKRISVGDAKSMIGAEDVHIVDIRDSQSFNIDHLSQAQNITGANAEDFVKTAQKDKPLLIYCYHGNSSPIAGKFFLESGFADVYSIEGGFEKLRSK